MISIIVKNLDKHTLYTEVLSISEYLCDEFCLPESFGIISMANQIVVDYILGRAAEFLLEMQINVDVHEISISFISETPLFGHILDDLKSNAQYHHNFNFLVDNFTVKADNKAIIYTFHVKPHLKVEQYLPVGVLQHKHTL